MWHTSYACVMACRAHQRTSFMKPAWQIKNHDTFIPLFLGSLLFAWLWTLGLSLDLWCGSCARGTDNVEKCKFFEKQIPKTLKIIKSTKFRRRLGRGHDFGKQRQIKITKKFREDQTFQSSRARKIFENDLHECGYPTGSALSGIRLAGNDIGPIPRQKRQGGGIEPLHVPMPHGLKPCPGTSLTHPG